VLKGINMEHYPLDHLVKSSHSHRNCMELKSSLGFDESLRSNNNWPDTSIPNQNC
jgi:hypothetical protein